MSKYIGVFAVPLMVVAGAHVRALEAAGAELGAASTWEELVPEAAAVATADAEASSGAGAAVPAVAAAARPVPLLLRDPAALLLQLLLLAPHHPPHLDLRQYLHFSYFGLYQFNPPFDCFLITFDVSCMTVLAFPDDSIIFTVHCQLVVYL
jgi:hypothetical protein